MKKKSQKTSTIKVKAGPPFPFVLDELAELSPVTRPMFGAVAVYRDDLIVLILRDRESYPFDNGVWLATTPEHHESLQSEFPDMRSIALLTESPPRLKGLPVTGWQNLPSASPLFEEMVMRACELVRRRDPRIGKLPKRRKTR
jgi:hypothetical protein